MEIVDLHIHSKFSRATSRDCDAQHLDLWARKKGVTIVGTGDFTHPAWRRELRASLIPAGEGMYALRDECRLPADVSDVAQPPRFIVTGEISSIYQRDGRTRKVHNIILLPSLEAADALSVRLERIGNIHSDGRPILGLDSRDLLEITLETCPNAAFIPAHIWTPHFSLFGAFSGFDTIEACFGDLTGEIYALETGLSSDPPMNWRVSALDRFTLVSNSDAHSPSKLAREANLIDVEPSYPALMRAIRTGEGFAGTIEFFPEEGKYHLDGHRACGMRLTSEETERMGGKCPVCGKRITVGVEHRVADLADRPEGTVAPRAKPYERLMPLTEAIASSLGVSAESQKTMALYEKLLNELGPELRILRQASLDQIERAAGICVAEGIRRLRAGEVTRIAGYDGEYGRVELFNPDERRALLGQGTLFCMPAVKEEETLRAPIATKRTALQARGKNRVNSEPTDAPQLNEEQRSAVTFDAPTSTGPCVTAVVAGPGTGKTKTLVERIAYLIEECGAKPTEITAVTFTNQAASEMRERLARRLGGNRAVRGMTIGTFHAVCLQMLPTMPLLCGDDALSLVRTLLAAQQSHADAHEVLRAISRVKSGAFCEETGLDKSIYEDYRSACRTMGVRDFDDLLLDALTLEAVPTRSLTHLLVDEFQDVNAVQRQLVRRWSALGKTLFVIGDPDQSIYGFRGASAACFDELRTDFPALATVALTKNYRSSPEILESALSVIDHNPGAPRTLIAMRSGGAAVRVVTANNPLSEGIFITREIAAMTGGTDMLSARTSEPGRTTLRSFSDMAVLCRTHRQLNVIEACLRHDGVPCIIVGRGDELADDAVQGALAFFRFLQTPGDALALATCLHLVYGVQSDTAASIASTATNPETDFQCTNTPGSEKSGSEESGSERFDTLPAQLRADRETFLDPSAGKKPQQLLERWTALHGRCEALERLIELAALHVDMDELLRTLALGEEADIRRAAGKDDTSGAVHLMTLHGAKGLEFPVVFVAGVCEGALPLRREGREANLAEERRLLFVGMTRAREELVLTASIPISPLLEELPNGVKRASAGYRLQSMRQMRLF